jgi:cephalosporin hydroxylase
VLLSADTLHRLVGRPEDLSLEQWESLTEAVMAFRPDLVIELGRGYGNSTAIFTDAAGKFGGRVVSVGLDSEHAWQTMTVPKLLPAVPMEWFEPLQVIDADITTFDFESVLRSDDAKVAVFWDAHGTDVAEAILERLLPLLPAENLVMVHDIAEASGRAADGVFVAGPIVSTFDEVVPLWAAIDSRHLEWRVDPSGWLQFTWR